MATRASEIINSNDIMGIPNPDDLETSGRRFKGKRSILPGAILLGIAVLGAATGLIIFGMKLHDDTRSAGLSNGSGTTEGSTTDNNAIDDGRPRFDAGGNTAADVEAIPEEVKNPTVFPDRQCRQPNYKSQGNNIVASFGTSNEQVVPIKGATWFGMENAEGVPYGLWDNAKSGTTIYEIVTFLADNSFNSVRLPLCVEHLSRNIEPDSDLVNEFSNKALRLSRYRRLVTSIVEGLGSQSLSVLLDFHTLTPDDAGELWFNNAVRDAEYFAAIDALAEDLCDDRHWNVMGIEIKNAPTRGTWGDGSETDWKAAAKKYGDYILAACPAWVVFVDGISSKRTIEVDGVSETYRDFEGGGLQDVASSPLELSIPNKLVWSPHYYTPSKVPQRFFYESGTPSGSLLQNYVELGDEVLKARVADTMRQMFGYLALSTDAAVVLGEFGGIVGDDDLHPSKTSTRVLEYIVEALVDSDKKYAGGYYYALNPGAYWEYNPADTAGGMEYGILEPSWRRVNAELLAILAGLNDMDGLDRVPCVEQ